MEGNRNLETIWKLILGELEVILSPGDFLWLKSSTAKEDTGTNLVIYIKSKYGAKLAKQKLSSTILNSVKKHLPTVNDLNFSVKNSNNTDNIYRPKIKSNDKVQQLSTNSLVNKYTFESFIVGSSNQLAFATAEYVTEHPADKYNPLFIYGPPGVGKTHLLWGINSKLKENNPGIKTVYTTIEDFMNEFVNAMRKGERFNNNYRKADVLLVDDTQFISGKERTQEEFFHTFNTLYQNNKQIILASDRPPSEIPILEERLRSRFEGGMVADISLPEYETRLAIINKVCSDLGNNLNTLTASIIANNITTNIRDLEGAVKKIIAMTEMYKRELSEDEVISAVGKEIVPKKVRLHPNVIIKNVCNYYSISKDDILSSKRTRDISTPRQVIMYLINTELGYSYPQTAKILGRKDHTTILHGVRKIKKELELKNNLSSEITEIKEILYT